MSRIFGGLLIEPEGIETTKFIRMVRSYKLLIEPEGIETLSTASKVNLEQFY